MSQHPGTLWPLTSLQWQVSPWDPFASPGSSSRQGRIMHSWESAILPEGRQILHRTAQFTPSEKEVFYLQSRAPGTGPLLWVSHRHLIISKCKASSPSAPAPPSSASFHQPPRCPASARDPATCTAPSVLCPPGLALSPKAWVHAAPLCWEYSFPRLHLTNCTSLLGSWLGSRLFRPAFLTPALPPAPGCSDVHV